MHLQRRQVEWSVNNSLFPNHMSFIAGPRQCGKTTMALEVLRERSLSKQHFYHNWDKVETRRKFKLGSDWLGELIANTNVKNLIVFDEIHKMRGWKTLLKGIYDQFRDDFQFVVTGSGRLDFFQRGGDSLAGRYDLYQLFPLSPGEINAVWSESLAIGVLDHSTLYDIGHPIPRDLYTHWSMTGGFPEPFLSSNAAKAQRWWKQYIVRITEEDLRDLTKLESVDRMQDLMFLLPSKVGSTLSINSLSRDLEASHATMKRYVQTLEQLYMTFSLKPFHRKIHRAIKKDKKHYFYHFPAVSDDAARFENQVALILYRWTTEQTERALGDFELYFLRDQDRREVDFLITLSGRPYHLFEVKLSDTTVSNSLSYYSQKLKIPGTQVVIIPGIKKKISNQLAVVSVHYLASWLL